MDQQTKQALKHDQFVDTTTHSLEWCHRKTAAPSSLPAASYCGDSAVVGGVFLYNSRSDQASVAFGAAMQVYQTPLAAPGQQVPPGVKTYASVADRAKASNELFLGVADKYGMTPTGRVSRYFAGLTYMKRGRTACREHAQAGSWRLERRSRRPRQALPRPALPPDWPRLPGHRSLQRTHRQANHHGTQRSRPAPARRALTKAGQTRPRQEDLRAAQDKDAKGPAGMLAAQKLNPAQPVQPVSSLHPAAFLAFNGDATSQDRRPRLICPTCSVKTTPSQKLAIRPKGCLNTHPFARKREPEEQGPLGP